MSKMNPASSEVRAYLEGVVAVCEANNFEKATLWESFSQESKDAFGEGAVPSVRFPWQSATSGFFSTVGKRDDEQIVVSLLTAVIAGKKVLFWFGSSPLVDYDMIRAWLEQTLPDETVYSDAANFINLFPTPPIPKGMKPWYGGDKAPDDWDHGRCLYNGWDGEMGTVSGVDSAAWKATSPHRVVAYFSKDKT